MFSLFVKVEAREDRAGDTPSNAVKLIRSDALDYQSALAAGVFPVERNRQPVERCDKDQIPFYPK